MIAAPEIHLEVRKPSLAGAGRLLVWLGCLIATLSAAQVMAQPEPKKPKKDKVEFSGFSVKTGAEEFSYTDVYFRFPNIGEILYFYDEDLLREIKLDEQLEDYDQLVADLESLVSNFAVKNFYTDTRYLWKLGQLYLKRNQKSKGLSLIRLAIKHTRSDLTRIKNFYDSATVNDRVYYVPLKKYYELVEYRRAIDTLIPPQSVLTRMNDGINSKYADYAPALSFSDDTLIWTTQRDRDEQTGKANEDLYYSQSYYGDFYEEKPFVDINTKHNEGSATISRDGKTLIFSRCHSPEGYGNCDIYESTWDAENKKWSNVRNLGPTINGKSWDSQPSLSYSGDTLFFASDRLGGFGMSDIYMSVRDKRGRWKPAVNLGPVINTRANEVSPFMHHEHSVLYFSSNGQLVNFGDFDIYKSYLLKGNIWTEPKNIGPLVNGPGTEYYFTIDRQSKKLCYAKSDTNDIRNLDLYSFPLPMEAQPLATTRLSGTLIDNATGKPLKGIVGIIDLDKGIEVAPQAIRPDGSYDFDLIRNNNYLLVIQGEDFFRIQEQFYLTKDTVIRKEAEVIRNSKVKFESVEFLNGSTEVLPSMEEDLRQVLNFLVDNPKFKLRISGHTDKLGKPEDNLKLSKGRSESIKAWLTQSGVVDAIRIEALGFGSTRPIITDEQTEADRRINRRVEFEIIPPKP